MKKIIFSLTIVSYLFSLQGYAQSIIEKTSSNNEETVFLIRQPKTFLQHTPNEVRNNKEYVLMAVRQNGLELQFASNELQNDKEVVMAAVTQNPASFEYANRNKFLANTKEAQEIALVTIKKCATNYTLISSVSGALVDVKITGPLQFFKNTFFYKKIALEAVKQCKENYIDLPNDLKNKKEFIEAFFKNDSKI